MSETKPLEVPEIVINVTSERDMSLVREAHLGYKKFIFVIYRYEETVDKDVWTGKLKRKIKAWFKCVRTE